MLQKTVVKEKKTDALDLWSESIESIPITKFARDTADTEKLLVFSETGAGKTTFYLSILGYLERKGIPKEKLKMFIIFPDRPTGIVKLYDYIPKEYRQGCIEIFPVNNYEETVMATATASRALEEHYKKTGVYGWLVFELMENYWTFSQDFYCRQAYGKTMGEYFAQMRQIVGEGKGEKRTAYEAFAGPFGGPWPIIKFFHNFNWIDRIKRFPYNTVFTSEIKAEDNEDSIFSSLGYRPAGEKHNQHRMDTILYLSHKSNMFFMKPFKLTGYKRLYGQVDITNKNSYSKHKESLKRLEELGHKTSKMEDLEIQAGIKPPDKKKPEPKPKEKPVEAKSEKKQISQKEPKKKPKKEEKPADDLWEV